MWTSTFTIALLGLAGSASAFSPMPRQLRSMRATSKVEFWNGGVSTAIVLLYYTSINANIIRYLMYRLKRATGMIQQQRRHLLHPHKP
jgi:hypothetical protein